MQPITKSLAVPNRFALQFTDMHRAWGYLFLAIVLEVLGLIAMKLATARGSISGHVALYVLVGLAYVLLAKAVQRISVGVAYAIWEGSGLALITLVSWLVFADALSSQELLGIAMAIVGIVLVNAGHLHKPEFEECEAGGHAI